ncbi:MAG: branched-chain amino acid ABC transporter permease [Alphaproteobacteria bacterium]
MELYGYFLYSTSLLTMAGIYAVMTLGLNVQWGFAGLFNVGIAGFFAIGAYVSAILTTAVTPEHLGGFELPFMVGIIAAMIISALVALPIGLLCVRLRSDYLAISTIGIAEILRLILKNEVWATNGARGISLIPQPFTFMGVPYDRIFYMFAVFLAVAILYFLFERARISPWGRVMTAIRENEVAARAMGKDVDRLRVQSFVLGSAAMGLAGAFMAHYIKFIGPQATEPHTTTFLVWVMLIMGGSGNNRGAILGALILWVVWSVTEIFTAKLPPELAIQASYIRMFLIGLVLQIILQKFPQGILPERRSYDH